MLKSEKIKKDLQAVVAGDVNTDIYTRIAFSTDASIYRIMPICVVCPKNEKDVAITVKYAHDNKIPVVARGAGSGLAGESLGAGIVLDFTRYMNKIIGVSEDKSLITVEPGAVLDDVNNYLAKFGKKIGPDPSSGNRAVIGGVVANNATGAHSLQFGYIAEHIRQVKAVMADGSVQTFDDNTAIEKNEYARKCYELINSNEQVINDALPRTKRNRSGYNISWVCGDNRINMAALLAGSEGTLAVFTEVTLRTVDIPKYKALLQLEFDSINKMALAVPAIVDSGATACELMDGRLLKMALDAMPEYGDVLPKNAEVVLLIEHIGESENEVARKIEVTRKQVEALTVGARWFFDAGQQKRIWKSRKDAVPLLFRDKSKKQPVPFIEDVSVDNKNLAEYMAGLDKILGKYGSVCACYGHAGDGELHVRPYLDLRDAGDIKKMQAIADETFELAWSLGGTISGEHADGLVRSAFIKRQYGEKFYEILRQVKRIFDPDNNLNPGKIINDDSDLMIKNFKLSRVVDPARMKTNLNLGGDFVLEIEQCNGDGVCRSTADGQRMCPVFRAMGTELACSRAKANLLQAWITGLLADEDFQSQEFKQILSYCINCKMCSVQCPSGVDISKLVIEARAEYAKRGGFTRTEFTLIHNRWMSIMGSAFSPISNWVLRLSISRWAMEKLLGIDRQRQLPAFERSSFIKKGRKFLAKQSSISRPIDKVVYFVDSYANYNDHQLGFAVVKLLRYNDIEVVLPNQRPAPMPAIVYGDVKSAKRDLRYIVENLIEYVNCGYKVICSEPSAALCLREDLALFDDGQDAKKVSDSTYELMEYLSRLDSDGKLKMSDSKIDTSYVYHQPCHLWALKSENKSIELLKKLCHAKIETPDTSCCGLAGTCGMQNKNFAISIEIGKDMAAKINKSKADFALTECAACKMQIEQMTDKIALHPVKVLAKAYNIL